jgi:hypothetical protein
MRERTACVAKASCDLRPAYFTGWATINVAMSTFIQLFAPRGMWHVSSLTCDTRTESRDGSGASGKSICMIGYQPNRYLTSHTKKHAIKTSRVGSKASLPAAIDGKETEFTLPKCAASADMRTYPTTRQELRLDAQPFCAVATEKPIEGPEGPYPRIERPWTELWIWIRTALALE